MTFEEILPYIKAGKKVVRTGWKGGERFIQRQESLPYVEKSTPYLIIQTESDYYSMFNPTVCDIFATDWTLVD
ncbi:DUF2829 domain-containing protein [Granulicatella sp. zg-ZJ]|uniref:DUF2829 domain-containing protein n=1 Tax=unclassified Granulicatella TaxID=2630493 RepID=UPI0013BEFC46|nr:MULTISPECIES: DUF2829 domain-containing protein [unclassified Granulicatella]MBS4750223.1 DUF2829 domain-containing protein [Carnobacteriaceae bacterium zg-ZUI78]NEW63339.1 DUF2829 domain-containing protein [Granulicatella sp. zg-ZJ]NEW65681.1 DUF2829 domain-containing protein [Granulicatella sp. zg-84]QMI85678.1 DUF2829 domain-containing protein [Carnobacteriaceae bacterium zg-84]